METRRIRRRHGLHWPFHGRQVCMFAVYLLSIACAALSISTLLRLETSAPHGDYETFSSRVRTSRDALIAMFAITFGLFLYVSLVDTSATSDLPIRKGEKVVRCQVCLIYVARPTRHCQCCHKCVDGFDHHCQYLNTCIGRRNLKQFRWLILWNVLYLAVQNAVSMYAISILPRQTSTAFLLCGLTILPGLALLGMLVLAAFQVYIYWKGMPTFEFAVQCARQHAKMAKQVTVDHHMATMAPAAATITVSEQVQPTRVCEFA